MLKDASKSQKISIFAQTLTSFMENNIPQEWNKFYLKDVSFVNLMMRRIYNVLIVANPYDAFMLEDDGRIEEKIYNEYMELGLRYPPTFTQVSTTEEAAAVLRSTVIDLVICMPGKLIVILHAKVAHAYLFDFSSWFHNNCIFIII